MSNREVEIENQPAGGLRVRGLLLLGAIALGLRVAVVMRLFSSASWSEGDAISYLDFARQIAAGPEWLWTPVSYRPPGYPLFLAPFLGLWGFPQGTLAALLAQAVISAGSVVLIYCLGRRLFGSSIALGAAAWATLYPQYLYFSGLIYRETLVVFGMLLLAWSLIRLPPGGSWRRRFGIAGLLFLLIHIDPRFGIHLILMPVYLLLGGSTWRESLRRGGILVLLVLLLSLPWGLRSSLVHQKLVLVNTRALDRWIAGEGVAFGMEQEPLFGHREALLRAFEQEKRSHWDQLDPRERRAFDQGVRPVFTDMGRHLFLAREFWRFSAFRPTYRPYPDLRFIQWSRLHNLVEVGSLGLLLPFFLVGVGRVIRQRHSGGMVLLALILGHWIPHILIHSIPRYRLPIFAFIDLLAFVGLFYLWERIRRPV